MQEKLICDIPHVKVPCLKCRQEIWVHANMWKIKDKKPESLRACSDCVSGYESKNRSGGVPHKQTGTDLRYHGEGI